MLVFMQWTEPMNMLLQNESCDAASVNHNTMGRRDYLLFREAEHIRFHAQKFHRIMTES